jgi:hypothetical protein
VSRALTRSVLATAVSIAAAVSVAACSGGATRDGDGPAVGRGPVSVVATSVDEVLSEFADSGLPAANPRDVSQQKCPQIGCTRAVDTDTVSVMKFPATGPAELYAGSTSNVFQIADLVLVFSPTVSAEQKAEYQRVIKQAVA